MTLSTVETTVSIKSKNIEMEVLKISIADLQLERENAENDASQQPRLGVGDLRQLERENAAAENGVSAPSGEEWYYQEAQKLQIEHPDWNIDQITAKMSETVWNNNYHALMNDIANSSSPEERDQKIENYRSQLLEFYASGINVDNDVAYLRNVQGVDHRYLLSPTNPAFIDATLSFRDMANGYHLEYNENYILWRVKASGEPHPEDLVKYYQQLEYNQSISDNLVAKVSMVLGGPITGKASQETSVVTRELTQTEHTFIRAQESSKAGASDTYVGVKDASEYLKSQGVPRKFRKQILESFDVRTIEMKVAGDNTYGLRFYDGVNAQAKGRYLFESFNNLINRENLALPREWNEMSGIKQWRVEPGATMIIGEAAPQFQFGFRYVGGEKQWYITNLNHLLEP